MILEAEKLNLKNSVFINENFMKYHTDIKFDAISNWELGETSPNPENYCYFQKLLKQVLMNF